MASSVPAAGAAPAAAGSTSMASSSPPSSAFGPVSWELRRPSRLWKNISENKSNCSEKKNLTRMVVPNYEAKGYDYKSFISLLPAAWFSVWPLLPPSWRAAASSAAAAAQHRCWPAGGWRRRAGGSTRRPRRPLLRRRPRGRAWKGGLRDRKYNTQQKTNFWTKLKCEDFFMQAKNLNAPFSNYRMVSPPPSPCCASPFLMAPCAAAPALPMT